MEKPIVDKIFENFSSKNKNPSTELVYKNDFTLLVAIILSAQATDLAVNIATKDLFASFNTPEQFIALGETGLKKYIRSIGLFNYKSKNIIALCNLLIKHYDSRIPNRFETLIKLPGVGRKTANLILNSLFGALTIAVDTHVFRVAKRIGLAKGMTKIKVEIELLKIINPKWHKYAHHWLILHGKYICKARNPKCEFCTIQKYCTYNRKYEIK